VPTCQVFHTRTALAKGLKELFKQLEERLSLRSPVNVYLAGGMAVHLYTASRVTTDVDAEFGSRVFIPNDLIVDVTLENGTRESMYFDTNYNSSFALMHEDYIDDAIFLDLGVEQIRLHILSPLDLAVSKIARFADNDKEDIAELVRLGLTTADQIEQRATSALGGYVGGLAMLRLNLRDAVALAHQVEAEQVAAQRVADLPNFKMRAGTALTFWQNATEALKTNGLDGVDWADVEEKTIVESISEHGQEPSEVADVICLYSPGAVKQSRQDEVRALVERLAPELQAQYAKARSERDCQP
jgi:hypothetical protein